MRRLFPGGSPREIPGFHLLTAALAIILILPGSGLAAPVNLPDTGQILCYDNQRELSSCPAGGAPFFGQDAQYQGPAMAYRDNGDGTVTDMVTGLMWSKAVDARKVSLAEARDMAKGLNLGGHADWRVPNIKELYSLMNFAGSTGLMRPGSRGPSGAVPYINTDYFNFKYGDVRAGERYIDAQWLSSTEYVSYTMDGARTLFGVNFADGRIKGYGYAGRRRGPRPEKKFYVRFVRGNAYGQNDFKANKDGTVTDRATGLTWAAADSGVSMTWKEALAFARASTLGGHNDWRLPNAKELQYIVDYTRSPDTTDSPALDPVFTATPTTNEAGRKDFGHYWTSTTHVDGPRPENAVTVCFGRAMGKMHGRVMDVHGAGAQRSDPKSGGNSIGRGPQGDARHGKNFVRLVRGGETRLAQASLPDPSAYPNVVHVDPGYEAKSGGPGMQPPGRNGGGRGQGGFMNQPSPPPDMMGSGQGPDGFGGPGSPGSPGGHNGMGFVERLDRDGDGRVSQAEFDGPPEHFFRFDRNGDGFITEDEAPSGPPPGRPPGGPGPGMD